MTHEPLRFGTDLIHEAQKARREAEAARERAKALAHRLGRPWPASSGDAKEAPPQPLRPRH